MLLDWVTLLAISEVLGGKVVEAVVTFSADLFFHGHYKLDKYLSLTNTA